MIYICVPSYNEGQTVGVVLWKVRQVMAELARDYQLLVADDGSTDHTPSVLEPYTRVLPLTVLRTEHRRGYADSLEMLLREAVRRSEYPRRDIIVPLQADFTEDPEHLTTLIRRIESGADIVVSNAGWGELPPPRAFRWGRALLKRMVRRFVWPEGARDPLTGLNAYRVVCVKRAIEERKGDRLLRFDGWAANAELLREAAPHARRVDAVDLTVRRERLQRPERFQFRPVFNEVLAFIRNRPTAKRSVEQLAADSVMGGRSQYRTLSAESLRETTVTNGDRAAGPARRGGQRRGQRGDRPAAGERRQRTSERSRGRTRSEAAGEERKQPASAEGQTQRKSRSRRKSEATPASADVVANGTVAPSPDDAASAPEAGTSPEAATAPARKRRSRKRGRRGGTNGEGSTGSAQVAEGTSLSTEETVPETVMNGADVPFVLEGEGGGGEAGSGAPKKRRRGTRGGRRRNRAGGKSGATPATEDSTSGPEIPPDAAAAG